jgi:hypothetical protein
MLEAGQIADLGHQADGALTAATPRSACKAWTTGSKRQPAIEPIKAWVRRSTRWSAACTANWYSMKAVWAPSGPKFSVASQR